jgi:hypothetical protein
MGSHNHPLTLAITALATIPSRDRLLAIHGRCDSRWRRCARGLTLWENLQ